MKMFCKIIAITWKNILVGIQVVLEGQGWIAGDGRSIKFQTDSWVSDKPLLDTNRAICPENYESSTARDLWQDGIGWRWDKITPFLSDDKRLEVLSVVLDTITGVQDCLFWRLTTNGEFTVRSAYELLTKNENPRQDMKTFFKRVSAPERVRFFLWLAGNQCVMTNAERKRRHLSDSDLCLVCKGRV